MDPNACIVFFASGGEEVTLDISGLTGDQARMSWLNPNTGEWMEELTVTGDSVELVKPGEDQWVVTVIAG